MRKIVLTLAALAAFGIALPVASNTASAETVIIKKSHRGRHYGWRHHHRDRIGSCVQRDTACRHP